MKRGPELAMTAAGLLLAGTFLMGLVGPDILGTIRRNSQAAAIQTYHGIDSSARPRPDLACQSDKCHDALPHKKDRTKSVFRNMHQGVMDCLSCHGKDAELHWTGKAQPEGKGWRIHYSAPTAKGDPHGTLVRDVSCRICHSESGRRKLMEKGVSGLSQGFADPIALRMIEGGARRWIPADIR